MASRKTFTNSIHAAVSRRDFLRVGGVLLPAAALAPSLFTQAARAATTFDYYISPSGSDSNPGTASQPWAITALNTKQSTYAGKSVGLMDGTYNVYSLFSALSHDGYTPALQIRGGTSSSPTVIQAVNLGKAIIQANSGSSYPPNNPVLGTYGSTVKGYVTIDGIVLTGSSSKGMYLGDYGAAVGGSRFSGIIVRNCELTGANGSALSTGNNLSMIELAGAVGAQIVNNYFHDNIGYSANNADHFSATLQWYGEKCLYEHNTLVNSGGFYGKETGNFGTTLRYNYVDTTNWNASAIQDFVGTGTTAIGTPTVVHHNVLIGAKAADMRPTLGSGYLPDSLQFYNNTMVILSSGQSSGLMVCVALGGAYVYNNIVYSQASGDQALCALNIGAPGTLDYNLYFDTSGSYAWNTLGLTTSAVRVGVSGGFSTWQLTIGGDAHSLYASNPQFVGSGTGAAKYALNSSSVAKTSGKSNGSSSGTAVEMGAWGNGAPTAIGCDLSSVRPESPTLYVS